MKSTTKVGLMTIAALMLLSYLVFIIGDFSFTEKGYEFIISFYSVNGLSKGSLVSMSGVKIGKVTSIEFNDDQVYVFCYISDKKFYIRRNSAFTISTAGLMGEKYIEIMPTRDYTSPYVAPGEVVSGTDPIRMDEMFEKGTQLIQKLQELTESARDIISDPELKENTRVIFRNAASASDNINEIVASLRKRTDSIAENLDKILAQVNEGIEKSREDVTELVANFRNISEKLSSITDKNAHKLADIVDNVNGLTAKLDSMLEKLNTNDKLTNDVRAMVESLRETSDNAKEISTEIKEIIVDKQVREKINIALDDAHKLAQAVDKVFLNIRQTRIDFKYMLRFDKDADELLSDISVDLYPSDKGFYRIGIEDVGGEDNLDAMIAKDADTKFIKRAGIISSKVGLGMDYLMSRYLRLSLDFIDTRDSEIRLKVGYLLSENIRFELRADDIAKKSRLNFGLEYKF